MASSRTFVGAHDKPRFRSSERPLPAFRACLDLDKGEDGVGVAVPEDAIDRLRSSLPAGDPGMVGTAGSNLKAG